MKSFVLTVTQLNKYVKSVIDGDQNLQSLYIFGEISNFVNHYQSGHLYFSLKDKNAVVRAVIFKSAATRLKFTPENGMKVIARGRLSVFERDGQYQVYVDDLQPDGVGALQTAFEQMKARLQAEGLFAEENKKPLPCYPARIGVITSPTGAAVRDIINVIGRRYPLAEIVLCPVLVQGEGSAEQIAGAIGMMNEQKAADVLIVGRGGGSIEELWAFNEEIVARAVAASIIPVVSAVGHETDFTICDFAADLRAPTPSAAAELVVPDAEEIVIRLYHQKNTMQYVLSTRLSEAHSALRSLQMRPGLLNPMHVVDEKRMRLDFSLRSIIHSFHGKVNGEKLRLAALAGRLDTLSPLGVLARGYALVERDGGIVRSVRQAGVDDRVTVRLEDGILNCAVLERIANGADIL